MESIGLELLNRNSAFEDFPTNDLKKIDLEGKEFEVKVIFK